MDLIHQLENNKGTNIPAESPADLLTVQDTAGTSQNNDGFGASNNIDVNITSEITDQLYKLIFENSNFNQLSNLKTNSQIADLNSIESGIKKQENGMKDNPLNDLLAAISSQLQPILFEALANQSNSSSKNTTKILPSLPNTQSVLFSFDSASNILLDSNAGNNLTQENLQAAFEKSDIKEEIIKLLQVKGGQILTEASKNLTETSKNLTDQILSNLKEKLNNVDSNISSNEAASKPTFVKQDITIQNQLLQDSGDNLSNTKKENNFLNSLALKNNNSNDGKISKAVSFVTQLSNSTAISNNDAVKTVEQPVINSSKMANDVVKAVKYMEVNNIKDLTVKINPRELGEVEIKLTMEGNTLKASLTASNKDTYNLLNSNVQDISNQLNSGNIRIDGFTVNIYYGDSTFFNQGSEKEGYSNGRNKQNSEIKTEGIDEESKLPEALTDTNLNILA